MGGKEVEILTGENIKRKGLVRGKGRILVIM